MRLRRAPLHNSVGGGATVEVREIGDGAVEGEGGGDHAAGLRRDVAQVPEEGVRLARRGMAGNAEGDGVGEGVRQDDIVDGVRVACKVNCRQDVRRFREGGGGGNVGEDGGGQVVADGEGEDEGVVNGPARDVGGLHTGDGEGAAEDVGFGGGGGGEGVGVPQHALGLPVWSEEVAGELGQGLRKEGGVRGDGRDAGINGVARGVKNAGPDTLRPESEEDCQGEYNRYELVSPSLCMHGVSFEHSG